MSFDKRVSPLIESPQLGVDALAYRVRRVTFGTDSR
jgi:hypothetical protein